MKKYQAAALALTLGAGGWSGRAVAQNVNSGVGIGPAQTLSAPTDAPATPVVEHLFGDWGGIRTDLGNLGITFTLDLTEEFAGNVSGGVKQGSTSANQIGAELDIDWEKLAGLTGFSTHTVVVNRSGSSDSKLFGDTLQPVQEIYGSGGDVAVHLVYIYGEEKLMDGSLDIAAGWMPVLNDFAASPLYCNYMSNGLCGNPKNLPGGGNGFSSYPDATFGGRVRVRPTPETYLQVGLYEVNQSLYSYPADRSGFSFDTSNVHGVEVPIEAAWLPRLGDDGLPGHYKLGVGFDTTSYQNLYPRLNGLSGGKTDNKVQIWALVDQMLVRNGSGDDAGIVALAGYLHNNPNVTQYADDFFAGVLDKGFWSARPLDKIGLLFTYQTVSRTLTHAQEFDQLIGLSYANGATGVQRREMDFEVNYDIHVFRGVNFEPDFQYVIHPNAQSNIHNAEIFGFKTHVTF